MDPTRQPALRPGIARNLGGRRGFIDGVLPPVGFATGLALVQTVFHQTDQAGPLAASKLVLGWPVTLAAVVLTLAYVRRATAPTSAVTTREAAA